MSMLASLPTLIPAEKPKPKDARYSNIWVIKLPLWEGN
jgi:hypothetical protein